MRDPMVFKMMPTSISVYHEDVNPIFGEGVTTVSLVDEAAGFFIKLEQDGAEISLNFDEVDTIITAIAQLKLEADRHEALHAE